MPRKKRKIGFPPGTPVYTGDQLNFATEWSCLLFNDDEVLTIPDFGQINIPSDNKVLWMDVRGVHETSMVEKIGQKFSIHPLALEDILDIDQRPKMDEYENAYFITLAALKSEGNDKPLRKEQVAIYFTKNFLITFQEDADDFLQTIRERILQKRGRLRQKGSDYLAYSIMDFVVDHYYVALDGVEKKLAEIDAGIHQNESRLSRDALHDLKLELIRIRKLIFPTREVINKFIRTESPFISKDTLIYLRDIADHSIQISDVAETYQDMLHSLHDVYHSEINIRLNNVMKTLTIISTIFIPLTFIVGVYGMNFDFMPELRFRYGYFIVLVVMLAIVVVSLIYFRLKKWM